MASTGLIIGIDYTDRYCQACYYSMRHRQPESISAGTDVMRYLIPSVLCYDPEQDEWAVGNAALRLAQNPGVFVLEELMAHARAGVSAFVNGKEYSYIQLLAVYFGKLLEFIQIRTSVMAVENITVTMKQVDRETKEILEEVFHLLKVSPDRMKLLSSAESFGYYMLNEQPQLWKDGSLLFDFSADGFFVKQLSVRVNHYGTILYVDEYDFSGDFSVDALASEILREQLDRKLSNLYNDLITGNGDTSVYFTGDGFDEQWFSETIHNVSDSGRAFKGNNIYVKGACLAGFGRFQEEQAVVPIICRGRTRTDISVEAWDNGQQEELLLSPAATDWYDAGYSGDFILENERSLTFLVTSLISGERSVIALDLSQFPERPTKTTRVQITISYRNEFECEISVTDRGFGEFFPTDGITVTKKLNLEGYI